MTPCDNTGLNTDPCCSRNMDLDMTLAAATDITIVPVAQATRISVTLVTVRPSITTMVSGG